MGVCDRGIVSVEEYPDTCTPVIVPGVLRNKMGGREWVLRPSQGVLEMREAHSYDTAKNTVSIIQERVCCGNK